jgi:hypothetical protein
MNVKKQCLMLLFFIFNNSNTSFNPVLEYKVTLPKKNSFWGVFNTSGALVSLKGNCQADALEKCSIINSSGTEGVIKGQEKYFQLCPSLPNGVQYWNPLELLNDANPCYVSQLSPIAGNTNISKECTGFGTLLSGSFKPSPVSNVTPTDEEQKLLQQLETKYSYVSSSYESQYTNVKQQAQFLINMSQQLQPKSKQGQDFLSIPYLAFAATFIQDFVTIDQLNESAESLFGKDITVATYFPQKTYSISLDLNQAQQNLTKIEYDGERKDVTTEFGGPLVRAANLGYIPKTFLQSDLFQYAGSVAPNVIQSIISQNLQQQALLGPHNYAGQRALLEEVFYLHLTMMQPLTLAAGMNNPDLLSIQNQISSAKDFTAIQTQNVGVNAVLNNNKYNLFLKPSLSTSQNSTSGAPLTGPPLTGPPLPGSLNISNESSSTSSTQNAPVQSIPLQNVYEQLFMMSRYMRALELDNQGNRTAYSCQPSDTFVGVIVMNNADKNVVAVSDIFTTQVTSGQTEYFLMGDSVDRWSCKVDYYSGAKYRSMGFTLLPTDSPFSVQITQRFGGDISEDSFQKVTPADIKIVDSANSIQDEVIITSEVKSFFNEAPSCPWAVVVEIVSEGNSPTFRLLALARLNPFDFPFSYSGGIGYIQSFNSNMVFNARQQLVKDLGTMHGSALLIKDGIIIPETNMNLVKFNGALSYGWGGKTPIGTALANLENVDISGTLQKKNLTTELLQPQLEAIGFNFGTSEKTDSNSSSDSSGPLVPLTTRRYELFNINKLGTL